ncbi:MAG: hypothetical protein WB239_05285 [Acidimicrobiia bacterium]
MIAEIFVPGIPKNANASRQWARFAAARERKIYREKAADCAQPTIEAGWVPSPFTTIYARHVSPVRRRRDPLGLAERLKPIMDGFVDAGLIPDDDEQHIYVRLERSVKGTVAGIALTLVQEAPDGR